MKGREHGVGLALLGCDLAYVDRVEPEVRANLDPGVGERLARALAALAGEWADVLGHVNHRRADVSGDLDQLALGRAVAGHEP